MEFLIIAAVVCVIFLYRRNRPEAKKKRAAKKARLSALSRRCNQFVNLIAGSIDWSEIAEKEYKTFSRNGESILQYYYRTDFSSLPAEVRLWYYFKDDLEKLDKLYGYI